MASILRVKLRWSGFIGGPGYSVLHFRDFGGTEPTLADAQAAVDKVDDFGQALQALIPYQTALNVLPEAEVLEDTTGELQTVLTTTPAAGWGSTVSLGQTFAGPVGAVVNWKTDAVRNGRRIRGRTFLVPLTNGVYEGNGTLGGTVITTIQTAASALRDSTGLADLCIYARPTPILDVEGNPTGEYNPDGMTGLVTSSSVPDMAAVLRSRRD